MTEDKDNPDEPEKVTKTDDVQIIGGIRRADEGKVLETKRIFYFHGDSHITIYNIIEIAVTPVMARIVDDKGHVFTAYFSQILGIYTELPKYELPYLSDKVESLEN